MSSSFYRKVETEEDYDKFYNILIPCWLEQNYLLECVLGDVSRYLILSEDNKEVGTVEIIPYNPNKRNYLDTIFPFKEQELIKNKIEGIVEIDGLSITFDNRNQGNLEKIFYTLTEHSRINGIKYAIGLINPLLYLAMRNTYKIPIKRLSGKIVKNNSWVYPVAIDMEFCYKSVEQYPWGYELYKLDNNLEWQEEFAHSLHNK